MLRALAVPLLVAAVGMWTQASAQTPSTQPAGTSSPMHAAMMQQCMQQCMQQMHATTQAISRINQDIEQARQSEDPGKTHAALDRVQKELSQLQERAVECMASMQNMPGMHQTMHGDMRMGHNAAPEGHNATAGTHVAAKAVCPVCGMTVDTANAPQVTYNGKTYYFCSPAEKATFQAHPGAYIKAE